MDDQTKQYLDSRIAPLEDRMTVFEKRLTSVEQLLAALGQHMVSMEQHFEARMTAMEQRFEDRMTAMEDRLNKRIEKSETNLLAAFHGWARGMEIRVRGVSATSVATSATVAGFDERLALAEERISDLERRKAS